ncbi:MAG: hypothetical protein F4Y99_15400 [Acidimicrobiaceae bacterium]|nr:hypothetical protein [Acidimicrobiaceae bacterium]MYF44498.1 hypothetical protein [Acidimicrobiaceae bacterium]MYJ35981.1 hypothetical protein [Acidimicrobiaceae bacterium]
MTTSGMSDMTAERPPGSDAATERVTALFADARALHDAALARMDAGDIRDAAEKAWCATKRAADGLIVARTGQAPKESPDTTRQLRYLSSADEGVHRSMSHYYAAREALHGHCFYLGFCEPIDGTERLIRETMDYIAETELLAGG